MSLDFRAIWTKIKSRLTNLKDGAGFLLRRLRALSFKTKASITVVVTIIALVLVFGTPDKSTVRSALPDYATPADVIRSVEPLQRNLDRLAADLSQARNERDAFAARLKKLETAQSQSQKRRR